MKPYVKILLRQNAIYIIILTLMIMGTIVSFGFLNDIYSASRARVDRTESEIESLTRRLNVLRTLAQNNSQEISDNLEIMNSLIPNSEDYFSIIYALEQLSQNTGFFINSYTVDLTLSKKNRLALSVSGIGNSQSFLNFLKEYNTGGGRLITAETIQLDSANNGTIKLQLYFYNKPASADELSSTQNYAQALANFEKIRSKVSVAITNEERAESGIEGNIIPKSNPF